MVIYLLLLNLTYGDFSTIVVTIEVEVFLLQTP